MGVYIRGMDEMPKDKAVLVVKHDDDGKVYIKHFGTLGYSMELIEVAEPHGDLIDRDALKPEVLEVYGGWQAPLCGYTEESVKNAPAVIGAEGMEE